MYEMRGRQQPRKKSEAQLLAEQMQNGEDVFERTPKNRSSHTSFRLDQAGPLSDGKSTNEPMSGLHKISEMSSGPFQLKKRKINEIDDYFDRVKEVYPELIKFHREEIDRMKYNCLADAKLKCKDDLSSDDCVENATVFQFLLYKQRVRHILAMWRKAFVKAKAAGHIIRFINDVKDKIYLLGISHNIKDKLENLNIPWFIIPPDAKFSQIWSLIIAVLLIYTATYMPYKTCFIDESTVEDEIIDWIVDVLFMCDILVNFLQATEVSDGSWVTSPKIIARNYLRAWFVFDLISVIPFQLIEHFFDKGEDGSGDMSSYNQLIRLARLPRLYRMTKLMRLFKIIKSVKKNKTILRLLKHVKLNSAITRMIQGMITALLLTHVFACFWFLTAKFYNFSEGTWISRIGIKDSTPGDQYIWSLYWAAQTITTVGYGDIPAFTNTEIIFSFIWMLVGVAFYSFIIGNFSSIISGSSQIQKSISYRVKGLSELARKAKLPFETSKQIKQFIESNVMALFTQDEDQQLIQTLPPVLRDEILLITYGELIDRIDFFKTIQDHDFMWKLLHCLTDMKFEKGDVLYWRGDDADSMYFILSGKVKLYADGNPFVKYQNGACFGDQDMLLNLPRDSKAIAVTHLHLKALETTKFEKVSQFAQETSLRMIVEARKKRDKHFNLIRKNAKSVSRRNVVISQQQQQQVPEIVPQISQQDLKQPLMTQSQSVPSPNRLSLGPARNNDRHASINEHLLVPMMHSSHLGGMTTVLESCVNQQAGASRNIGSARSSALPSEFADNQGTDNQQSSVSPPKPAGTDFPSNHGKERKNSNNEAIPLWHRKKKGVNNKSKLTRKHTMIDQRLDALTKKNSNFIQAEKQDSNTIKWLGGKGVPMLASQHSPIDAKGQFAIDEVSQTPTSGKPRSGNGRSRSQQKRSSLNPAHLTEESKQPQVKLRSQSTADFKRASSNHMIPTVNVDSLDKDETTGAASSKDSSSVHSEDPGNQGLFPDLIVKLPSQAPSNLSTRADTIKSFQKRAKKGKRRQKNYMLAVENRVSLDDSNLNKALQISSRVKNVQKNKQLMMLSERIKKQTQDQLGNRQHQFSLTNETRDSSIDSKRSQSQQDYDDEQSPEMTKKIADLKKLEEIREESELSDSDDQKTQDGKRRTLLDKVVGEVFGKDKQRLYEMFPTIAVITVPKMPIITPKGDEIIIRKKYNTNMHLLTEAFEQKAELYDSQWQGREAQAEKSPKKSSHRTIGEEAKMMKSQVVMKKSKSLIGASNFTEQVHKFDPQKGGTVPKFVPSQHMNQSTFSKMTFDPLAQSMKLQSNSSIAIDMKKTSSSPAKLVQDKLSVMPALSHNNINMLLDSPRGKKGGSVHRSSTSAKNSGYSAHTHNISGDSSSAKDYLNSSEMGRMADTNLSMKFMSVNGRHKSKLELKHDFVSPDVFAKIKRATKSLSRPATKTLNSDLQVTNKDSRGTSQWAIARKEIPNKTSDSPDIGEPSQLVSLEDGELSEVISANADIERTNTSPLTSELSRGDEELDCKRRLEILQQLKEFLDTEELNTPNYTQRSGKGSGSSRHATSLRALSGRDNVLGSQRFGNSIEFVGNESLKSIVKFNLDSGLLGLNTFEVISMFDQVHQALSGMKRKLKKVSQNIESIEKKQLKLDFNADKMIEKMRSLRTLKQEVRNLNQKRMGSKDSRGGRKGRQLKGQQNTSTSTKSNRINSNTTMMLREPSREMPTPPMGAKDKMQDIELTVVQPITNKVDTSMSIALNTETSVVNLLDDDQQLIKDIQKPKLHRPLLIDVLDGMSAEQIARLVSNNQNGV